MMKMQQHPRALSGRPFVITVLIAVSLMACAQAGAAVIGVLQDNDGRQVDYLSILGASSAEARLALQQDGHSFVTLASLEPYVLNQVDIVWLPLLDTTVTYTAQERINILQYVIEGGSVIWIGDADVYNLGDDSFLSAFGMNKLAGNLDAALAPAAWVADYPIVTGPHGAVASIAENAGYGLFAGSPEVVDVFVGVNEEDPPESGTFAGFLDSTSGFAGAGRVALICDASIFGQMLDQEGQDHRAFLRNTVKWVEAASGYTPSGIDIDTGELPTGGDVCTAVQLVIETVSSTGETTVSQIGAGRCGFDGIPQTELPADFLGHGLAVQTTAGLPAPANITMIVTYDEAELIAFGIDEIALRLFKHDPDAGNTTDITAILDTTANTITGAATSLGSFLIGAIVPADDCNENAVPDECDIDPLDPDGDGLVSEDCNANGLPDECEIDENSIASGGPFYCQVDCRPDCNNNGIPDSCDVDDGVSQDCNNNAIPDECEIDENSSAPGGPFHCQVDCEPDCNDNGIPDSCDIGDGSSQDCNDNDIPDECETGLAPEITQQPTNQGTCNGGAATFFVVATGPGQLTFQWRKDGEDLSDETNADYAIDPVTSGDAGTYDVIVTNDCGSTTSDAATLTVHEGPTITEHPTDQDACEAAVASFSIVAAGTGDLSYQWNRDGEPLFDGGSVTGAETATLQIDPVDVNHAGQYTCEITDACGTIESQSAVLGVDTLLQVSEGPADQSACPGDTVVFGVTATGTDSAYQWQYDDGGGFQALTDGENIDGSATPSLTITNVMADAQGQYRCSVSGACGEPTTTDSATLTVGVDAHIVTEPADQSACPGDPVTFTIEAAGTDPAYQWQFDGGAGWEILQDEGGTSGTGTDTLVIAAAEASHDGTYRCIVSGECGPQLTSATAALTVGAFPQAAVGPTDQWVCPTDQIVLAIAAIGSELSYQWQFDGGGGFVDLTDGDGLAGSQTNSLTIHSAGPDHAGQYHCVVSGNCGTPATSAPATVTVGADVAIDVGPIEESACPGSDVAFTVQATGSGLTYQWQFNGGAAFVDLVDGDGISGATTDALIITGIGEQYAGEYQCLVFGACGDARATDPVTLLVTFGACDCNNNGQDDADDITSGTSQDCNANGIPDECDVDPSDPDGDGTVSEDCNANDIPDECDIDPSDPDGDGTVAEDCNANGIPDSCDIDNETSTDCNGDDIPDECQLDGNDCDGNGVPDECDPPYWADAGEPLAICTGLASALLGGEPVAGGSNPPYTYLWQTIAGPDGGATILTPTAEHTRIVASIEGDYEIEVQVSDSSNPPCVTTDTVIITATHMTVDAGESFAMCADSTSEALSPLVFGGAEPYTYLWTVEDGSPSTSPDQFTGTGPQSAGPTFMPDAPGIYTLRVTALDAGDPTCTATETLTIQARGLAIAVGDDFAMCAGAESALMDAAVVSPGTEPLSYLWTIEDGSPDTAAALFTGTGDESLNPTFAPVALGDYVLRLTVHDSSTPPCQQTETVIVTVGAMTVDAGGEETICVGGAGVRLSPTVDGGFGELYYVWSVEPGSPSAAPSQFTDPSYHDAAPRFMPAAMGNFTLRLTVTDSGSPPCVASDTIVVRATSMTVDAGDNFTTKAFQPSHQLGAIPVVGGGDGPFVYTWEILGGPSRDSAQLSATNIEHPFFTPTTVGSYEIVVTVTDANGTGCAVSDTVVVEAIASTMTLPVNVEGRLFMTLQVDHPHTRGEVRVSYGAAGAQTTGEIHDDGPAANFDGMMPASGPTRRMFIDSELIPGSFVAVLIMYYDDDELGATQETDMRLHRFNTATRVWQLAAEGGAEQGPFPVRPERSDLGRNGVDPTHNYVWAVVDYFGEFAIGLPSPVDESSPAATPANLDSPEASEDPAALDEPPPLCGLFGPATAAATLWLMLCHRAGTSRRRHRTQ